jgi:DNA polymerase (family 10)
LRIEPVAPLGLRRGLEAQEVAAQQRAIERLNRRYGASFHVFKGIESDILGDGSLDYPEKVLASF